MGTTMGEVVRFLGVFFWEAIKVFVKSFVIILWQLLRLLWNFAHETWQIMGPSVWNCVVKVWGNLKKILRGKRRNASSTNFCPQLVDDFENLAKSLAPDRQYLQQGHHIKNLVFQQLKDEAWRHHFRVDRTKLAGSIAKKTAISFVDERGNKKNPDFDLVVFVHDIGDPPFQRTLQQFKQVVESIPFRANGYRLVGDVIVTRISVQFTCFAPNVGEIKFDLLPARNHVQRPLPFADVGGLEAEGALEAVREAHLRHIQEHQNFSPDHNKFFSSSFCEKTVKLIQDRMEHDFYLKVVRLAKFWNYRLELNGYVPARSSLIEIIAIHSQIGKKKRCLIGGFRRFLVAMTNFSTLVIQLGGSENNSEIENPQLVEIRNAFVETTSTPIILDPVNPYNNLAHGIRPEAIRTFEQQARRTIQVLDGFKKSAEYESVENVIDKIFCHKR